MLLLFLGSSWGLYFSMLKIAVLSGISYTGILTLATVGVAIGMSAIALLRKRKPEFKLRHNIYIYFELIRTRGPIFTSHANYVMVVSGVLWGMLIFAERPSSLMWLSAALLIASLYLVGRNKRDEPDALTQEE